MKTTYQFVLAAVLVLLMNLVPAYAFASRNTGIARSPTTTYHDRTPTAHTHGSHPHRS